MSSRQSGISPFMIFVLFGLFGVVVLIQNFVFQVETNELVTIIMNTTLGIFLALSIGSTFLFFRVRRSRGKRGAGKGGS